jgi:hypothetical protein
MGNGEASEGWCHQEESSGAGRDKDGEAGSLSI